VIDHGSILYDGKLENIVKKYSHEKLLAVSFTENVSRHDLEKLGRVREYSERKAVIAAPLDKSNAVAARLLEHFPIDDLNIQSVDIEDVIRRLFASAS
jgi:ABC-type uncharacterized transport system ATPase subunit